MAVNNVLGQRTPSKLSRQDYHDIQTGSAVHAHQRPHMVITWK